MRQGGRSAARGRSGVLYGLGVSWQGTNVPSPAAEARPGPLPFGPEGPEVWVLWGPSGTGKSRFVAARWPDAFWKAPESKWWDGYSGHETVVLDDFKDYGMPLVDLQRLLDWYPLWVEVKGERPHAGQEVRHHGEHLPMTGTYAGTRIVPSAAVSPTSPSASADSSSARPAGSHLGPLAGAEVQGNTSTAPEPQPLGDDIMSAIANWQDN